MTRKSKVYGCTLTPEIEAHETKVATELEAKPRPQPGWINGYMALWLRPGDIHCLAAGEVTSSVQVQAVEAVNTYLKEPG